MVQDYAKDYVGSFSLLALNVGQVHQFSSNILN